MATEVTVPVNDFAPDWRVKETLGGWILECQDPVMLQWHEMTEPGSLAYTDYAYEQWTSGETPLNFDDWEYEHGR